MTLQPGLLVLHGNRLEDLAATVLAWLARHPLAPLEQEVFLVQSNGMAEWLKMAIAQAHGVCAAARVELPARFVWRAWRAVLGRAAVPALSPLDKLPLTWRFMSLLQQLAGEPGFEPVAGFQQGGDAARRLQLAQRLADLFDQYQVYRGDWLQDWAEGRDQLGAATLPPDQAWQPALWRAVLDGLAPGESEGTRASLQQRFMRAVREPDAANALPRRVVLFGTTQLPQATLEMLAALAGRAQVLLAVPNPCRWHWADTIAGRELLQAARRRMPLRGGIELAQVPLQDMHAHGHPLLSAWGRQARDFVRQLDAFDDAQLARQQFALPRLDLFDDAPGTTLLQQLQARIRDLVPLTEPPQVPVEDRDRSIVFHIAHSAQREVEILHDQLLHLLAHPPGGTPLNPRDIVVMVPDIELFAPAVRAVFGQHPRGHARHIPWGLADQRQRGQQPLLLALEWLLRAPQQRFAFSELRALLDTPAAARRLGLNEDDVATLLAWAEGAGLRWGLSETQRAGLGLQACGGVNSWHFGLQRLLLGYATGELEEGFAGIEPHAEVAGLQAGLAGTLALLLERLQAWWAEAGTPRPPEAWGQRLRSLVQALFDAADDTDRALLAALDEALAAWLQACESAAFSEPVDLAVVREAWLQAVDEPGTNARFKAGGVTFCTLLPMRAIPFEVVCLLGMNDGDYPRRSPRSDFDLMALMAARGQARPGDRARRDDDRQLMLDALLSARRVLYVSWAGRSQRDNQVQPPSVLVSQLRDHLAASWGAGVLSTRTTEHPLQPFSRRYFEPGAAEAGRMSYAAEWRQAHAEPPAALTVPPSTAPDNEAPSAWTIARLAAFLRNPVQAFFRQRLQVVFGEQPVAADDDETFAADGLQRWQWLNRCLLGLQRQQQAAAGHHGAEALVARQLARLQRGGQLPLAGPGQAQRAELQHTLQPMVARWLAAQAAHPQVHPPLTLRWGALEDSLQDLRASAEGGALWIELQPGRLLGRGKSPVVRGDKLLPAWLRCLAAAAAGQVLHGLLIGSDAVVQVSPPQPEAARQQLQALLQAAHEGLSGAEPLPAAVRTGLAWLADPQRAAVAYEGSDRVPGENREPCLARLYPSFDSLAAAPGFEAAVQGLYGPFADWLDRHVDAQPLTDLAEAPDE